MRQAAGRLSHRLAVLGSLVFKVTQRKTDHTKLTRHIVELNKQQSSAGIINEAARCLKEMLNYRLFAFVINKETGMDVWLAPRMYITRKYSHPAFVLFFTFKTEFNYS